MKIYDAKISYSLVREDPEPIKCDSADNVVEYMRGAFDEYPEQESFWVILLNTKNVPKGRHLITLGVANACMAMPREVFRAAILGSATAIVCVHNHPSGDPAPSQADMNTTRQLREAAKILGIILQDHVIIGNKIADPMAHGRYSFREAGLI